MASFIIPIIELGSEFEFEFEDGHKMDIYLLRSTTLRKGLMNKI